MSVSREALLSIVSHDVRNPLSAILMNAVHLLDTWPVQETRPRARRQVEVIRHEAERLNDMLFDFVDALSIEADNLRLQRTDCELVALLERVVERSRPVIAQRGLELSCVSAGEAVLLHCDRERVVRVLGHLIRRAVALASPGASLAIETQRLAHEQRFFVVVSATLPENEAECDPTSAGMGLYVARGIIEAHGGRIWIENDAGRGRFCFALPRD